MSSHPENRLKDSASPYLRSAAHQPIDWHEWGDAAFARAKSEDKPILLDIGAVWCHWCHVIDRESYENAEIAKIINEHFVAVKVDRDERPDVDSRYQSAISAISGQGGWPLTGFLLADGKPLAANAVRGELNAPVPPGGTANFTLQVAAPKTPGSYQLQVDLVEELVFFFSAKGNEKLTVPVTVQ